MSIFVTNFTILQVRAVTILPRSAAISTTSAARARGASMRTTTQPTATVASVLAFRIPLYKQGG